MIATAPVPTKEKTLPTRRDREDSATAFKTTRPIELLVSLIDGVENQAIAQICYWGCARANAVTWLKAVDLTADCIRFRRAYSKTKTFHKVPMSATLRDWLGGVSLPETGYLFPAKGSGKKPTKRYKQHWVNATDIKTAQAKGWRQGSQQRTHNRDGLQYRFTETVEGVTPRPVRSVNGFDAALNKAVDRLINDPDSGIDDAISGIPEIAEKGRSAFYGVSTHTFRRSMCQYLYYTLKWKAPKCMAISGHADLGTFYAYIRYDVEEAQADFAAL